MEREPWPILRFLHEGGEITKSRNRLPHWQQDGRTYFLTFRLADSIPGEVYQEWRAIKDQWLKENPEPRSDATERQYRELLSLLERYLDESHGSCVLATPAAAEILEGAFAEFDQMRYQLHAWVIMPNHVHVLLSLHPDLRLEKVVGSWKRFSAKRINALTDSTGPLWQSDYFDRLIRDWDHLMNVARYIRRNPVKARLTQGRYRLYVAKWVEQLLG